MGVNQSVSIYIPLGAGKFERLLKNKTTIDIDALTELILVIIIFELGRSFITGDWLEVYYSEVRITMCNLLNVCFLNKATMLKKSKGKMKRRNTEPSMVVSPMEIMQDVPSSSGPF